MVLEVVYIDYFPPIVLGDTVFDVNGGVTVQRSEVSCVDERDMGVVLDMAAPEGVADRTGVERVVFMGVDSMGGGVANFTYPVFGEVGDELFDTVCVFLDLKHIGSVGCELRDSECAVGEPLTGKVQAIVAAQLDDEYFW